MTGRKLSYRVAAYPALDENQGGRGDPRMLSQGTIMEPMGYGGDKSLYATHEKVGGRHWFAWIAFRDHAAIELA